VPPRFAANPKDLRHSDGTRRGVVIMQMQSYDFSRILEVMAISGQIRAEQSCSRTSSAGRDRVSEVMNLRAGENGFAARSVVMRR